MDYLYQVAVLFALVAFAHGGAPIVGLGGLGYGIGGLGYAGGHVAKAVAIEAPQPYEFGYSHHTDDGAASSRQESSDAGNNKQGSYSIQNPDGTYRHVEYVADAAGFRAVVKTNEHGTAPQNPAAVQVLAEEPPYKVLPAPAPIVKAVHAAPLLAHAPIVKAAIPAYAPTYAHAAYAAPAYAHAAYGAPALVKTHAPALGAYYH